MTIHNITDSLPKHPTKRYRTRKLSDIKKIIVHHSATKKGTPHAFATYHVHVLDWPGIGYHYVIEPTGKTYKTQSNMTISYHAKGANTDGLGICLVGNFDVDVPTPPQWEALLILIRILRRVYPETIVLGHREVPGTTKTCPGKNFDMDTLRESV